jgi:hypothetical protein
MKSNGFEDRSGCMKKIIPALRHAEVKFGPTSGILFDDIGHCSDCIVPSCLRRII